ncbi:ATP-dependent RNA helicase [Aureococcus anophagefferens]|uniref:ATP-dependent RNA helicase n=1 Tax=Aureococcus anophagefferens TaxID=44056 RepID=A0ABR1GF94_AURAN
MGKKQRERKAKDKARNAAKPSAQDETFVPFAEFLSPELAAECGEAAPAAPAAPAPEPRASSAARSEAARQVHGEGAEARAARRALRDAGRPRGDARAARRRPRDRRRGREPTHDGAAARDGALLRDRHGLALDAAERDSLHARGATVDDADAPPVAPPPEARSDGAMDDERATATTPWTKASTRATATTTATTTRRRRSSRRRRPCGAGRGAAAAGRRAGRGDAVPSAAQMMAQLASLKTSALATAPTAAAPAPEDAAPLAGRTGYVAADLEMPAALGPRRPRRRAAPAPARPRPAVVRPPGVAEARQALPCCGMEQELVDAVSRNDVVVVCGATGSGKSTQLPQFLYEAGLAATGLRIAVTQPRRVAAVTTCERVAFELGAPDPKTAPDALVGYRTRYDAGGVGPSTRLLFETDGVLLNECKRDLLLRDYAAVILDEAHERSLNTDVLLGLLSRAVPLRRAHYDEATAAGDADALPPLKLVVMSATLRVDDFLDNAALWGAGPRPELVSVEARQHPVTTHFAKVTELDDYAGAALAKTRAIHEKLPDGAILVFLTGKREIDEFCDALRGPGLHVVPLHAQMSLADQRAAFAEPPPGSRKIVAATNVAETSLTIPGVTYVVDSGRAKRKVVLDAASGAVAFRVGWISRAAADQRAGRAGREGPGHCYRLYSSALFAETFDAFEAPEVARLPLLDVVLAAKDLGVADVGSFPFPSRPPPAELAAAGRALERLGCVGENGTLSPLGAAVARLPVGCRHACALAHVARNLTGGDDERRRMAALAVALVAAGSEACPFGARPTRSGALPPPDGRRPRGSPRSAPSRPCGPRAAAARARPGAPTGAWTAWPSTRPSSSSRR